MKSLAGAAQSGNRPDEDRDATVHGFRSSFRDWAGNVSNFPREITETALAQVIGDKAEQDYRRSDALERRKLMEARAAYCERPTGHVVQIGKRKPPGL